MPTNQVQSILDVRTPQQQLEPWPCRFFFLPMQGSAGIISGTGVQKWTRPVNSLPYLYSSSLN